MKTKLFVIIVTPRKQDIPQVVTTFTYEGRPIFCYGNCILDRAKFFTTYEEAYRFLIEKVLPIIDAKEFAAFVRPCEVNLMW